jgi:hypothetical protein
VRAALHALQHRHLQQHNENGGSREQKAAWCGGDIYTSSFSTAFLLSQRSACAKRNSEHELQKHARAGNLDGGVLLRGEVDSSKYLAEGTCALGLKKMQRDWMFEVSSSGSSHQQHCATEGQALPWPTFRAMRHRPFSTVPGAIIHATRNAAFNGVES